MSRPGPLLLRLELDGGPGVGDRVRDLVARESACCSFLAFTLTEDRSDAPGEDLDRPHGTGDGTGRGGRIRLGIAVDAAHEGVVEALATRTRAFVARNSPRGARRRPVAPSSSRSDRPPVTTDREHP
ncbi:hypothetical protein ABZZ44_11645 [Streptomyces sp. NPDC006460]|uniref:hypothetical protein n=1 Tax=Streptomyces sp. NPDC006460 TaxID=3154304 RepID=UPI0033BC07EE